MKRKKPKKPLRIVFQFTQREVLEKDFSRFLREYDVPAMSKKRLRELQGATYVSVFGYDDDPRVITEILEVREFFQAFYKAFPHWFYFFPLECLSGIVMCLFKEYQLGRKDGVDTVIHGFRLAEMAEFCEQQMPLFANACERSGMTEDEYHTLLLTIVQTLNPSIEFPRPHGHEDSER
jgi:hypothetical protein